MLGTLWLAMLSITKRCKASNTNQEKKKRFHLDIELFRRFTMAKLIFELTEATVLYKNHE